MMLARLSRSGDLTAVRVPGAADEAARDLARSREDAVRECRNARHRLKALLLRSGITYAGKSAWTAAHLRWLATLKLEHAAQQIALQEYLYAVTEATARIARLEQALRDTLSEWSLAPVVQALQAMRGGVLRLVEAVLAVNPVAVELPVGFDRVLRIGDHHQLRPKPVALVHARPRQVQLELVADIDRRRHCPSKRGCQLTDLGDLTARLWAPLTLLEHLRRPRPDCNGTPWSVTRGTNSPAPTS
jgi:hypothetical protein